MGELIERVKLSGLVNSEGTPDFFKKNSLYFYEKYNKTDNEVKSVNITNIYKGGFYFFHYKDDSNWMRFAPVFVADYKKWGNGVILLCVNFNFVPLEIRIGIFDKYLTDKDFEKAEELNGDHFIDVKYKGMYDELKRLGFEYSLVEFNAIQLTRVHRIDLNLIPRFLYSQHPIVKYDPKKLIQIWESKIQKRIERDSEMMQSNIEDFFNINKEISDKYSQLENHIKRIRTNMEKYGKR
jgi:hypothetical protein